MTNSICDFLISFAIGRHIYKILKQLKQCLLFLSPKARESLVVLFFPAKGARRHCFSMMLCSHEHPEGAGPVSGNGRRLVRAKQNNMKNSFS